MNFIKAFKNTLCTSKCLADYERTLSRNKNQGQHFLTGIYFCCELLTYIRYDLQVYHQLETGYQYLNYAL
ncbi:hypothetical protein OUZ56_005502 [Daphnia magna]|uniref:Uncharacterized protein n=1 Tax=Daphnia magna TaxID=35525 RepID=A0ABQ9YSY8_9CRUS|nr:hypothetical protein OUZ56_005502 [Daphnia magna]